MINQQFENIEARVNAQIYAAMPDIIAALIGYIVELPAFRNKPVGAPGSVARIEADHAIRLEDEALAALRKAGIL